MRRLLVPALALMLSIPPALAQVSSWQGEWPSTDFTKSSIDFVEILSGGPPKDGIPAIDDPSFAPVSQSGIAGVEPVISVAIGGDARAYPLQILMWHEIANDTVGGVPITVTFCPLCNTGIVFDRRVDGRVLDFGTTGKLRNSDLVMYDRQTESWWQQFTGEAIVGEMTGTYLDIVPARLESLEQFRARHPDGQILIPDNEGMRRYGANPYVGYDSQSRPYSFYSGPLPDAVAPLSRVVRVEDRAWALDLLRAKGRIEDGDLVITWSPGQVSALDDAWIAASFDVGNVVVQRTTAEGPVDVPYTVDFAFAFSAFYPDATIVTE